MHRTWRLVRWRRLRPRPGAAERTSGLLGQAACACTVRANPDIVDRRQPAGVAFGEALRHRTCRRDQAARLATTGKNDRRILWRHVGRGTRAMTAAPHDKD